MTALYDKHKKYLLPKYHARMAAMRELLGGECVMCGSVERLEIDHIDPSTKSFSLAKGWGKPWAVILEELAKCQLLCYECHKHVKTPPENSIREKQRRSQSPVSPDSYQV